MATGTTVLLLVCAVVIGFTLNITLLTPSLTVSIPQNAPQILQQCAALQKPAGPPPDFHSRVKSDRFVPGTQPILITNATIWTGAYKGTQQLRGDILLEGGLVKFIGSGPPCRIPADVKIINAKRAWVTPGLVDLHSHAGVISAPALAGAFDVSSGHGPILPWLRSLDGLNTHDDAYELALAGGVTSGQILPGSGNAIGGQAFFVKYRKTAERSPTSMLIEPPHTLNGTGMHLDPSLPPRWRHLKQACGENLRRHGTRMDSAWAFRSAYDEARKVKDAQDEFCRKAESGQWKAIRGDFPESLKWEMLVDVLRGRVKISNHCYEEVDIDNIVRLSNEFQFHVSSFHHASEAWLVPDVLKRMWGGPPAVAIFATNHRYKRESYRGSEFAPRVLADNGIPVVMKSDHPVINSRYLLHEAQQAHHFGLAPHLALASVTVTPATAGGLAHRIGVLQIGADADVVIWDSHPLAIGATPTQVFVDGIAQFERPVVVHKPAALNNVPRTPNFDEEAREAVEYEGLQPLGPKKTEQRVLFYNVTEVWTRERNTIVEKSFASEGFWAGIVVVENGKIVCTGTCLADSMSKGEYVFVNLEGGSIFPGLTTFGSPLGLEEISGEPSTGDGLQYNALLRDVPAILGDAGGTIRAVDTLQFQTRNALIAYRAGVTAAITAIGSESLFGGPSSIISGLSTAFRTGAANALEAGALIKPLAALHVTLSPAYPVRGPLWPSVSTQIAVLRRLLLGGEPEDTETGKWFAKAGRGEIPLIIDVTSADIMATLLQLRANIKTDTGRSIRLSFSHATEAHILAEEIAAAGVGVILRPVHPYPGTWTERRIVPGPPLSEESHLLSLLRHNVTVAIGVPEAWAARNTRFDLGWAVSDSNGQISKRQALALATTNLEVMLGVELDSTTADLVAFAGGSAFDFSGKAVAVISPLRNVVDLF